MERRKVYCYLRLIKSIYNNAREMRVKNSMEDEEKFFAMEF